MEPKLFEDLEPEPKIILIKHLLQSGWSSVVDPNTLNLDPDPGFWPNLDPDPDLNPNPDPNWAKIMDYMYSVIQSILKEKIQNNF